MMATAVSIQYYDEENRSRMGVAPPTFSAQDAVLWIVFVCLATLEELRTYSHRNACSTTSTNSGVVDCSGGVCGGAGCSSGNICGASSSGDAAGDGAGAGAGPPGQ